MLLDGAEHRKARLVDRPRGDRSPPGEPRRRRRPEETRLGRPGEARSEALLDQLTGGKVRLLEDGVIGGVSGALLVEALRRSVPVSILLVSAGLAPEGFPDHRAGATLIETLDRLLPELKIDTGPLRTQAEMIERALRAAIKGRDKDSQPVAPPGRDQRRSTVRPTSRRSRGRS